MKIERKENGKGLKFYTQLVAGIAGAAVACVVVYSGYKVINYEKIIAEQERQSQIEQMNAELQQQIYQKTMEYQVEKAERVISSLNSEVELILLTESGTSILKHERPDTNWFTKAAIDLNVEYQAIFSIPTKTITMMAGPDGTLFVEYNTDYIGVKSIDLQHNVINSDKALFGKDYNPQEVAALVAITREDLANTLGSNKEYISTAEENLIGYVKDFAEQMGVYNVQFKAK